MAPIAVCIGREREERGRERERGLSFFKKGELVHYSRDGKQREEIDSEEGLNSSSNAHIVSYIMCINTFTYNWPTYNEMNILCRERRGRE
jgi:hypothetical protein